LGAAIAERLAERGVRVVLAGRKEGRREDRRRNHHIGGGASHHVVDATDFESTKTHVSFTGRAYGPVDFLVNNGGLMLLSYRKDVAVADWNKMIGTNLCGNFHGIAAVLPDDPTAEARQQRNNARLP